VTVLLTPVTALAGRSRRGGNRLDPDRYPIRGPVYARRRSFNVDPERRDRNQRNRTRRAIAMALTRGELPDRLAVVLYQLLDRCTDTLLCPSPEGGPACSGWWSRRYIHNLVLPTDHQDDELQADGADRVVDGEVFDVGARTAGRWMAQLAELGWVEAIHRHRVVNGEKWGTSNLWRFRIPDHLRAELHAAEDAARSRKAGRHPKRPGPGRAPYPPNLEGGAAAAARLIRNNNEDRRRSPCPTCEGACWVPAPGTDRAVVRCGSCHGTGTTRAGP
jgi:hypothetical protein